MGLLLYVCAAPPSFFVCPLHCYIATEPFIRSIFYLLSPPSPARPRCMHPFSFIYFLVFLVTREIPICSACSAPLSSLSSQTTASKALSPPFPPFIDAGVKFSRNFHSSK
jgi:hypothetical protein